MPPTVSRRVSCAVTTSRPCNVPTCPPQRPPGARSPARHRCRPRPDAGSLLECPPTPVRPPRTGGRAPRSSSACSLVTPAQIESTLGRTVGAPSAANSTATTTCTYPAASGRTADSVVITFRSNVTAAPGQRRAGRPREGARDGVSPVSVTGAQAFSFTTTSGSDTITSLVTIVGGTSALHHLERVVGEDRDVGPGDLHEPVRRGVRIDTPRRRPDTGPSAHGSTDRRLRSAVRCQPPEMSWTFCLPAVTKGIISRSSAPTFSIWCSWPACLQPLVVGAAVLVLGDPLGGERAVLDLVEDRPHLVLHAPG